MKQQQVAHPYLAHSQIWCQLLLQRTFVYEVNTTLQMALLFFFCFLPSTIDFILSILCRVG